MLVTRAPSGNSSTNDKMLVHTWEPFDVGTFRATLLSCYFQMFWYHTCVIVFLSELLGRATLSTPDGNPAGPCPTVRNVGIMTTSVPIGLGKACICTDCSERTCQHNCWGRTLEDWDRVVNFGEKQFFKFCGLRVFISATGVAWLCGLEKSCPRQPKGLSYFVA
jgi:hypothetical protein